MQTEREAERPQHPSTSVVGMDWGLVNFVTLSDGEVVDQCQPLKKFLPQLAKLQRRMARKKKFSKNWRKAKACISKLYAKVANIRKDFVHRVSNDISKNHVVVVIEDLQVKSMSKSATKQVAQKSGLNRSILDASPFDVATETSGSTMRNRARFRACAFSTAGSIVSLRDVPLRRGGRPQPNCTAGELSESAGVPFPAKDREARHLSISEK